MHHPRAVLSLTLALAALLSAACEPDPLDVDASVTTHPVADTLPVLGQGIVAERFTGEVASRGSYAYTTTWSSRAGVRGNGVKVWNVAGAQPQLVDSLIVEGAQTIGDVQISDDGALLMVATERTDGSIVLYDLANPAKPNLLSRFMSDATRFAGVHTAKFGRVGGRLYAFLSVNPAPPRLVIVEVTDPLHPVQVLERTMGNPFIHDVFLRDGILFTALWNDGIAIWDLGGGGSGGSPANPILLGSTPTVGGQAHNVWWYHDSAGQKRYAFVGQEGPSVIGSGASGDVHVLDVSNLKAPREVAFYHVPGAGPHNFAMDEASGTLYAAFYNGGVRVLDVRGDLAVCSSEERAADGRCDLGLMKREAAVALTAGSYIWGVARNGDRLFASDMIKGLFVVGLRH
jgi:hypothetical protein